MEPLTASVFASIGSAFKFADVAVRIAEVGSENAVFVRAICIVRSDLEEVERLLSLDAVSNKLTGTPGKLPWVKAAIQNTRCALNEIGKWVERARVEQETTGSIKFETRVRWVFNDHEKLLNRKTELSTCHQQLSNVLGYLIGLEDSSIKPKTLDFEDASYFDDILSQHRKSSRPQTSSTAKSETHSNVHNESLSRVDATSFRSCSPAYSPPLDHSWGSPKMPETSIDRRDASKRLTSMKSPFTPPNSPPPTYATAISLGPAGGWDSLTKTATKREVAAAEDQTRNHKSSHADNSIWAYRSNFEEMNVPELAGDTVLFSATNSAGPVNPYELCTGSSKMVSDRAFEVSKPHGNLAEMLGDLHFPAELPSNDPGPPPGYPPRSRAKSGQAESNQLLEYHARRRTTSEIPSRVQRRPLPANALSDSFLTAHELAPPLVAHNNISQASSGSINTSNTSAFATELSSSLLMNQRPASYTANRHQSGLEPLLASSNRHYSVPTIAAPRHNEWAAAAFSAESTSSWGLDTEPKRPKEHSAQELTKYTRMQSQKRLMDLLGSIDS